MRLILCGSSRSGTTITMKMLNSHPEIHITNEGRAFWRSCVDKPNAKEYFEAIQRRWNRRDHAYRRPPKGFDSSKIVEIGMKNLKSDDLDGRTQAYCDAINIENWKYTGDKGADPEVLIRMCEEGLDFHLIWIHRDGRDVAHSGFRRGVRALRRGVKRPPPWSDKYSENANLWSGRVLRFLDNIEKFRHCNYTIIRLEDYVDHPGKIGKEIDRFLGIKEMETIEKAMIDPRRINKGYGTRAHPDWRNHFTKEGKRALAMLGYING